MGKQHFFAMRTNNGDSPRSGQHMAREELREIVESFDDDGSGELSFKELRQVLDRMKLRMKLFDLKKLWAALDQDGSGVITTDEFIQLFLDDDAEMTGGDEEEDDEFDVPLVPKSPDIADAIDLVVRAP